ncbi:hypothetical protein [Mycolicibacter nonchromogenicus]|uniref:hypothetical protein n=1 Tax=Mycolicibacter nonchromogenicus TaxID=1782 RepID=UPI0010556D28|nr:hypothetical protein [Mycolicibacter nonchromogenicus]
MTENDTTSEAVDTDTASESFSGSTLESPTEHEVGGETSGSVEPEVSNPNKEAAAYRRRLRDTEAERDQLASRLADAQRAIVTSTVAQRLQDPADFWSTTELADVLGDDGGVDAEKVSAAIKAVLDSRPHWAKRAPATESTSSVTANGLIEGGRTQPSFADAFKPPEYRNTR